MKLAAFVTLAALVALVEFVGFLAFVACAAFVPVADGNHTKRHTRGTFV